MPVDLCPYSECELRVQCALQADDISCDRHACLRWVDRRGIWYIAYVFTARLWGTGHVYASRVSEDVCCGGGLSPGCVCLCVHACLPCGSSLPAFCIWYMAESARGRCVYTCVSMYFLMRLHVPFCSFICQILFHNCILFSLDGTTYLGL